MTRSLLVAALLALALVATAGAREASAPKTTASAASRDAAESAASAATSAVAGAASPVSAAASPASAASAPAAPASGPSIETAVSVRGIVEIAAALTGVALCGIGIWLSWPTLKEEPAPQKPSQPGAVADATWPLSREGFAFRRHWGSIGGESTGWNLSPRFTRLATGLAIGFAGVCLLFRLIEAVAPPPPAAHAPVEAPAGTASAAHADAK